MKLPSLPAVLAPLVLLMCSAHAQRAATPPASGADPVVELSPFLVQNDQDVGYLAANTLAGSRLNTALKDTPSSISVFTKRPSPFFM